MVNVRNIKASKFISLGFETKKEALEFIKQENLKSNKKQNENNYLDILEMKRRERNNRKVESIVTSIVTNINKNEDITINETMSPKMTKDIIKKINIQDKKLLFTIQYDNNEVRSYVNDKTNLYEENLTPYGSDTQEQIINHNIRSINVKEFHRTGNHKSIGAFFRYYNTTEIDLSKYGIYHNMQEANYTNNCLIHTLIQSNIFSEEMINTIKLYCKRRETSLKTLHSISEEFGINFNIYRYRPDSEKIEKKSIYNMEYTITINLSLYDNHWFLYEEVNITKFFVNHYNEIKNKFNNVLDYKSTNTYYKGKYQFRTDRKDCLNSLSLIHFMYKNNLFQKINMEDVMQIPYYEVFKNDEIILNKITESNYRLKESTKKEKDYDYITFADFESTTMKTTKINADCHKAFTINYLTIDKEHTLIEKDNISQNDCFNNQNNLSTTFLDRLKHKSIIYFHNLKYDKNFLFDHLTIIKYLEKEGQLYEIKAIYNKKILYFRDSYKLIANPLSDFAKMFGLQVKKEVFPYNFYNESNIEDILNNKMMLISSAKKTLTQDKHSLFDECLQNVTHTKARFNALEYAKYYCEQDVQVLYEGIMIFRKLVLEALHIDIFNHLTISSIAEQYLINEGCYENVYEISGVLQAFITKSVYGGRVMISKNKPIEIIGRNQDFDACGLYASAMHTMKGFPIGIPSIIDVVTFNINVEELYYIEIELLDEYYTRGKGNKIIIDKQENITLHTDRYEYDYDFPLWVDKENDVNEYTNFPKNRRHVVNNEIMNDLIKFYKIERDIHFRIIQGVIFKDGYNNKINDVMQYLYNERKIQKKNDNKVEQIYKLIMNSSYGKTLTKFNDTSMEIFTTNDTIKINSFIYKQYNNIKEILYTKNHTIIKLYNEYGKHWNCAHVGSAVLARSKVIMNKIFYECHYKGLTPFYQDTDSIHIPENQITLLPKNFIGNDMCQFHCDFNEKPFKDYIDKNKEVDLSKPLVYSSHSIFLAKKCYIDVLHHQQSEKILYHIRFKGINEDIIINTAIDKNMNPYELYQDILKGNQIDFNDSYSNKPRFKQNNISSISNRDDTIKSIKISKTK